MIFNITFNESVKKILNSKNQLIASNLQKDNSPEKRRPDMKRSLGYSKINHNFEKGLKERQVQKNEFLIKANKETNKNLEELILYFNNDAT